MHRNKMSGNRYLVFNLSVFVFFQPGVFCVQYLSFRSSLTQRLPLIPAQLPSGGNMPFWNQPSVFSLIRHNAALIRINSRSLAVPKHGESISMIIPCLHLNPVRVAPRLRSGSNTRRKRIIGCRSDPTAIHQLILPQLYK